MPRKDLELWAAHERAFSIEYRRIWDHFNDHKNAQIQKYSVGLECESADFSGCSYVNEYPSIFWLFLLNGFFSRVTAPYYKLILDKLEIGIKYSDLKERGIIASDELLSSFGWKVYCAIKELGLGTNSILHMMKNQAAVEALTTTQLKQYLADQCIEYD